MAFSAKLKELRESRGLSQEELAAKLNIPRSSITHYENSDDRLPRKSRLLEIANFFSVSVDFLLSEESALTKKNELDHNLERTLSDPELGLWFKDIKDASPEKQEELRQFWEFIKEKEKNRKIGDKQG
ncbi:MULTISPECIES: helix-turn-helix domain-containing protein [Bacillus cereus group]|uniref:helix-turn-helix domain-containing protein n=1 Tax=Bacillus cereus group TaxID=86661 RepID=UPI0011C9D026|nr:MULTISPECIES: helix-turn-helix transcriptional regulator [Bacillus cereus group]MEB8929884.1 helix-turn-helix transcriptional regulator [Bacillus cereus]MCR6786163.1 helix-turn-helix transcriptional regulator [Bacillus thuringiensis]MCR6826413.1 helix-turn-helix transcriptional regulator [Bacillus thuringiensis]MCR6832292.1 helix-turn-helix transcriptional regulator [Bacillus thuringiensis]MEB9324062.1 helix-turn-helix transcriptional regulator [Bacillus cereus]